MAPITTLVANDHEKVDVDAVELTFKATEEPQTATLERVWIDDPRPRSGASVPVKILLRSYRGEDVIETVPIDIPANARGSLSVMVVDGARLPPRSTSVRPARRSRARSRNWFVRSTRCGATTSSTCGSSAPTPAPW